MGLPALKKYAQEIRLVTFDFSSKLATGDTLSGAPSVTVSAGLTVVGTPTLDASLGKAYARISGGAVANDYEVRCEVNTTAGDLLREVVTIQVRDDAN